MKSRNGGNRVCGMLVLLLAVLPLKAVEKVKVPVSRDTWVSAVEGERSGNNGASTRVKLKGVQEFTLLDFNPAPFAGKKIRRGTLHLNLAGKERLGRVTVSSIAIPWQEGRGKNYAKESGAACFELPGADPDITAVILERGGSIWGWADASDPDENGWQSIEVSPEVLQARVEGRSHGFAVIDDVGNEWTRKGNEIEWRPFPNRYFYSRDQNASVAPYFTLELEEDGSGKMEEPAPVEMVRKKSIKLPPKVAMPKGEKYRGLFGEALGELALARGETGWVRSTVAELPESLLTGWSMRVLPIGAHGDALGGPEPKGGFKECLLEFQVEKEAPAGVGIIRFADGGELSTRTWNFYLPEVLSFVPQMNAYGLPEEELEFYRLAHRYRTCLNILRYGWNGRVAKGCAPEIREDGTWDWSAWDRRFGSLLDGSAFADLPRGKVPVDAFYLPLNENWPMDHEAAYRGGYWIEDAYGAEYWQEFRAASERFIRHLGEQGWGETVFEFFLNGKVYFKAQQKDWRACSSPWIFDEPVNSQDFWALRRFGQEFLAGAKAGGAPQAVRTVFRCDISRPEWQRDFLDGICGMEVMSGALRRYHRLSKDRQEKFGHRVLMYGSPNPIGTSPIQAVAWALDAWSLGADGIVPWQTIGNEQSWESPDQTCLFYPFEGGAVPSVRLVAMCAAQQTIEYLTLLQQVSGVSRDELSMALRAELDLEGGRLSKESEADAGTLSYKEISSTRIMDLRRRIAVWLDEQKPPAKRQLVDWRPSVSMSEDAAHHTVLSAEDSQ